MWPRSWLHFKISDYKVVFCGQIKKAIARYQLTADDEALLRMLQEELTTAFGGEHKVLVHKPEGCIFLWVW